MSEYVMIRRNVLQDACSFDDGIRLSAQHAIEELLAKPAEQHQGEPVGYVCGAALDAALNGRIGAESIAIRKEPTLYINKPLYTHADPGEVERLRAELGAANAAMYSECEKLRAQLAERDALLVDIRLGGLDDERCARVDLLLSSGAYANAINKHPLLRTSSDNAAIEAALSSSAEPSTPVEIDERAEFDAAYERGDFYLEEQRSEFKYQDYRRHQAWAVWKARAALERKP